MISYYSLPFLVISFVSFLLTIFTLTFFAFLYSFFLYRTCPRCSSRQVIITFLCNLHDYPHFYSHPYTHLQSIAFHFPYIFKRLLFFYSYHNSLLCISSFSIFSFSYYTYYFHSIMSNKVTKMRSALRNFGVIVLLYIIEN